MNSPTTTLDQLSSKQLEAVQQCCRIDVKNRVTAVSGQAGTGKTTILRHVYDALIDNGYDVVLCAPTGKAAKRITEATGGIEARTIHRLLEYNHPGQPDPVTGKVQEVSLPKRTKLNPMDQDVVLVDESTMINTELYRNLIDAMKPGACIRFFGDLNQLPPIEENGYAGPSPFAGILSTAHIQSTILTDIFRQGEGSGIVYNGQKILRGTPPLPMKDFGIRVVQVPIRTLGEMCRRLILDGDGMFNRIEHQIITPARQGKVGTMVLNNVLCNLFDEGTGDSVSVPRKLWEAKKTGIYNIIIKVGQKVIANANMYDLRQTIEERYSGEYGSWIPPMDGEMIFNGESGIVQSVEGGYIAIDVGDRVVTVPPWMEVQNKKQEVVGIDPRMELEHAYAITTHKAQGSEYDTVLYFMSSSGYINQCRSNFYTGVTRARRLVSLVSDRRSFQFWSLRKEGGLYNKGK